MPKNGANPPSERDGRTPKGIAITLAAPQEKQLRDLAAATGISIRELREGLESSAVVAEAITEHLKRRLNSWIEGKARVRDIFAPEKEGSGG